MLIIIFVARIEDTAFSLMLLSFEIKFVLFVVFIFVLLKYRGTHLSWYPDYRGILLDVINFRQFAKMFVAINFASFDQSQGVKARLAQTILLVRENNGNITPEVLNTLTREAGGGGGEFLSLPWLIYILHSM